MYGKIFESIYDGTISGDWKAMVTFQQMIILADEHGVVDITAAALSRRTGIPLYIIEYGIKKLQEPDPCSRSPDSDGRRITLIEEHRSWGWQIVNYLEYRNLAKRKDRAQQSTDRTRRWREKHKKNNDGTQGDAKKRLGRHTDTDTSHFPSESAQEADHVIWNTGIELLGNHKSDRSLLGKWVKEFGKEKVAAAIAQAAVHRPVEPKAYITAALQERVQPTDPYYKQLGQAVAKC